jgi:hypothetical protein
MKKVTMANLLCAGALALSPVVSHAVVGSCDAGTGSSKPCSAMRSGRSRSREQDRLAG